MPIVFASADDADIADVVAVDLLAQVATNRLRVVSGELSPLTDDTVAISKEFASENGFRIGSALALALFDGRKVSAP